MLSHDVLPSPALLDFLREQALSKTPQSGGSLQDIVREPEALKNNVRMENTPPEIEFAETIAKIKYLLKGKSYSDISDILIHVQSSITEETIY
ncbi:hypothetical protein ACKUCE_12040 [Flavobacterium psychrophilum]|uniref:hypothetical protein n=1 Tax=Flavobacterium psychrophilum TaxID=96345 RepID=UPI0004E7E57F|nr:hypothetical protein [Flavobacterium psychrophilum]AIJ37094.1 hypothetical protein FPSM_00598 [Flavobacterium psychrophilum]EKT3975171.1 hypothetical protein [Flavobacterium psychrophilum]EKT4527464.1 hypothetical protein [Flavobacterium psychrophilum]EKT4535421.1 hypothetical protein [Flavobacterium psychrophilum]EKT4537846.1 hypothetical protein [Flavobacterium psychrophilum]